MANVLASVSVVIPCYCCARTIERAVASICQQTQKPAEVILVDDGSGDETLAILERLVRQFPSWIKLIVLPENLGAASARNRGWETATQPYIAFLDADDAWHPQKIEIQYAYMQQHTEVVLSGHGHRIIEYSSALPKWQIGQGEAQLFSKSSWMLSNRFTTPSVMIRRDIPQRFKEKQRYVDDHLLWLEVICSGGVIVKLSEELVGVYKGLFGVGGLSADLWLMEKAELNNYKFLYYKGVINLLQYLGLILYSGLKFIRRLIICWGGAKSSSEELVIQTYRWYLDNYCDTNK